MRNVYAIMLSAGYLGGSILSGSELPQSSADSDSNPQFLRVNQSLPEELKPFVTNETPGIQKNVTLAITQEQYTRYRHLIDPLTHVSIIIVN